MNSEKLVAYWRERANGFPRPSQEEEAARSQQILERVKGMGVVIAGTDILEIGSGTGLLTIPLAREARSVTAIDLAPEMLSVLHQECTTAGNSNIILRCASWQQVDPPREGLSQAFDSAWTVRATAVKTLEDLKKMEDCAKTWCIFAGAEAIRRIPALEAILAFHDIPSTLSPSPSHLCTMLEGIGRRPIRDMIRLTWERTATVEETFRGLCRHIELFGNDPQTGMIEATLRTHFPEGTVRVANRVDLGLVVWRVQF